MVVPGLELCEAELVDGETWQEEAGTESRVLQYESGSLCTRVEDEREDPSWVANISGQPN